MGALFNLTANTSRASVKREYRDICGTDITGLPENVPEKRSPFCINMYKDRSAEKGALLRTRPGIRACGEILDSLSLTERGEIYGVTVGEKTILRIGGYVLDWTGFPEFSDENSQGLVHNEDNGIVNTSYYTVLTDGLSHEEVSGMSASAPVYPYAVYGGCLYIYDKNGIFSYDGTTALLLTQAYIDTAVADAYADDYLEELDENILPFTHIHCNRSGEGTHIMPKNVVSKYFAVKYVAESGNVVYKCPDNECRIMYVVATSPDNTPIKNSYNSFGSWFTISAKPGTGIIAVFATEPYYDKLSSSRTAEVFDGRVFVTGSEKYKNTVLYSAAANPLFFSEYGFFKDNEGAGNTVALSKFGNSLVVVKNDGGGADAIYIHTPSATDNELAPKIYPSTYGLYGRGCVNGRSIVTFGDEVVFLSKNGVEAIVSADIEYEKTVKHMSSAIDGLLTSQDLSNACLGVWKDYVVVMAGSYMFLGDRRRRFRNAETGDDEYEWFVWAGIGIYYGSQDTQHVSFVSPVGDFFVAEDDKLCFPVCYHVDADEGRRVIVCFDNTAVNDVPFLLGEETVTPPIYSCVAVKYDNFGCPNRYKTYFRRACAADIEASADSNIEVFSVDDSSLYTLPAVNSDLTTDLSAPFFSPCVGYKPVYSRKIGNSLILRPNTDRFISSGLVFSSTEPFGFLGASVTATVGAYIR